MKDKLITSSKKIVGVVKRLVDGIQAATKKSNKKIDILEQELAQAEENEIDVISNRDHWSFWLIGLTCILLGFVMFKSANIIYLIITAFIISMALESIIGFFQKRCSRGFSIGISYFLLIVFLLSVVIIVIPFIVAQVIELLSVILEQLAARQSSVQKQGLETVLMETKLPKQIKEWIAGMMFEEGLGGSVQTALLSNVNQLVSFGTSSIKDAGNIVVTLLTGFFSTTIQTVMILVMSIFFSIEKTRVIHLLAKVSGHTQRTELALMKLYRKLGLWLRGQGLLCLSIFVLVGIGLNVLSWIGFDLPNKMTLAIIAGMVEFIPYLGPFLGMFPALLIALSQYGFYGFLAVLIMYTLIQQSENNILVPMVMSHTLGSSPLLILICMIMGGTLFGFLGILLAVPISVIISILYDTYSNNK